MIRKLNGVVLVLLLCSCGGGGGADSGTLSSCSYVGGRPNYGAGLVGVTDLDAVADGNLTTFAEFTSQSAGNFIDTGGGAQFPGGSNAGVFVTPPGGMSAADITVSTFLDADNATVESATGPALTITPTQGDPATDYISFNTTAPFNGVKLTINTAESVEFLVYEFCGAATVR